MLTTMPEHGKRLRPMTSTATTHGTSTRLSVLALALAAGPGCACFAEQHASLIHSRVSGGAVQVGLPPHLRAGMPLPDAKAYLESCGFRPECRENRSSTLPASEDKTLHYVRIFPHPAPFVVTHPEVHVLILHDGNTVKDIKSEKLTTTVG
jgi:hypothetical protein